MKPFIKEIDKANHIIIGMVTYCIAACFLHPALAMLAVVFVAFAKECWDYIDYGKFDVFDFLYTIGGSIPALILTIIKLW